MNFKEWLKANEMAGTDAITSDCRPTADYQVWGACSERKPRKKKHGRKHHEGTEPIRHATKPEGVSVEEVHGNDSRPKIS